jgi:DNA-binding MarR family transcriptional regulator
MKSQDIVILFKLLSLEEQEGDGGSSSCADPYAVRSLEASLGISKSEVSASLKRSIESKLVAKMRGTLKVNRRNLAEFVLHGLKYTFPVKPGAPQRGIPTAFAAPMLEGQLISAGEDIYVWPYSEGHKRGPAIKPLFQSVPNAALRDERLYRYLALTDAIRIGGPRESGLAKELLEARILKK